MKNLSRGAWLALAAVVAVPTTVAIAKSTDGGWRSMTPETRSRLEDGRIAMAKAALQLNADQEKLWQPVEEQVRASFKARADKRAERAKKREERRAGKSEQGEAKRGDLAERYEKMSQRLSERADRMKAFSTAFTPFYASLNDEQKDVLRPLMRQLSPGFGDHGHHGKHWAFGGGWGPGGGPKHDGWHKHGGHGDHDHGGATKDAQPAPADNSPPTETDKD
ncbi:hypothetical protein DLM45_11720 [Hyphomicrobium methylovorum]|uniref:Spy/CpxP family protein refolding chaperone n=1 Tax=Hyphomicrobium methylovorum TaxID=84 RepID=UPI0015E63B96|nr:Spy/CpxP family protein refolding chaperone [Hyphomicrobium methylovorum]MBA2126881.1 hypothetical protein [Hyphomicrobium methylovorum]